MKVKAALYLFTSEQEQNQMFHICSCSLQHYHVKAKGVFQCSTAHCFRMEMETSVKTPACLCQMSPWWGHNEGADSHLTNHTLVLSAISGERRGNKHIVRPSSCDAPWVKCFCTTIIFMIKEFAEALLLSGQHRLRELVHCTISCKCLCIFGFCLCAVLLLQLLHNYVLFPFLE